MELRKTLTAARGTVDEQMESLGNSGTEALYWIMGITGFLGLVAAALMLTAGVATVGAGRGDP